MRQGTFYIAEALILTLDVQKSFCLSQAGNTFIQDAPNMKRGDHNIQKSMGGNETVEC